jgi:DME family drug/metabolite transporter
MNYSGGEGAWSGRLAAQRMALPAVALAAALWAVAGVVASRLFALGVDPLHLVGARAVIAALGLAVIPASWRGPTGDGQAVRLLMMGLALALVTATYYLAIERLPVAVGIVLQYTGPALVVVWTAAVMGRSLSPPVVAALAGATTGVVLITGLLSGHLGGLDGLGIVMGVGAAVTFAAYTILSELVRRTYRPLAALFRAFAVAAALWVVVVLPAGAPRDLWAPPVGSSVLFVGVGGTLVPFLLYVWAVAHVRAERAAIAATLEPVVAALIAWTWLGQTLSASQIAGGVLVTGSVAALQVFRPATSVS